MNIQSYEMTLALRYLKKSRHGFFAFITTLVAIGGITIGVAAMIITLSVMTVGEAVFSFGM
jgi:lipoprotein-releasing system permease protein